LDNPDPTENRPICTANWYHTSPSYIVCNPPTFGPGIEPPNISPEYTLVVLAPNEPLCVPIHVRSPENIPLDLFLLQDLSYSFRGDLLILQELMPAFVSNISAIVYDVYFGFGSHVDKPIEPFGFWSALGEFQDYEYVTNQPLSGDASGSVYNVQHINSSGLFGGDDTPECHFDAICAIAHRSEIGWRAANSTSADRVNRILIIATDAPYHEAGDVANAQTSEDCTANPNFAICCPPWLPSNGNGIFGSQTRTTAYPELCGLLQDYPSVQQAVDCFNYEDLFPIFAIAPTVNPGTDNTTWGLDVWTDFMNNQLQRGVLVRYDHLNDSAAAQVFIDAVLNALIQITQTISLLEVNTTNCPYGSPYVTNITAYDGGSPIYSNAAPGEILNFWVCLNWDGNTSYPDGGNITVGAFYPLQNYIFANATIEVIYAPKASCCYCGDGDLRCGFKECEIYPIVNYTTMERATTPNPCCNTSCDWVVGKLCSSNNLCYPGYCTETGICQHEIVSCVVDTLCATNTCIAGVCTWGCVTDQCCDDGNNCTEDTCISGSCYYTPKECDCNHYNNCLGCLTDTQVQCAWDPQGLVCTTLSSLIANCSLNETRIVNSTTYPLSNKWGSAANHYWYNQTDCQLYCNLVKKGSNSNAGAIAGGVIGAAVLAFLLLLLLLLLLARLRERLRGSKAPSVNCDDGALAAATNPLYQDAGVFCNPIHE